MTQDQFCFKCNCLVESETHLQECMGQPPLIPDMLEDQDDDGLLHDELHGAPEEPTYRTVEEYYEANRCEESAEGRGGFVQCCLLKGHKSEHVGPDGWDLEAPDPLEVLYGFTVVRGRGGMAVVLPLDTKVFVEREPTERDIQTACREVSDDLLAHRAAEYSETPTHLASMADILGELTARVEKK